MHRPSYREIPGGFVLGTSDNPTSVKTAGASSDLRLGTIEAILEASSDVGGCSLRWNDNVTVADGRAFGVGCVVGIHDENREAYHVSGAFNARVANGCLIPFIGTLEETLAAANTVNNVVVQSILPLNQHDFNAGGLLASFQTMIRPSVALSAYANAANVQGLVVGFVYTNHSGGTNTLQGFASVNVSRFERPDYIVQAPVN